MKVHIYGARCSLPTAAGNDSLNGEIKTNKYGGNTTCIFIEAEDGTKHIIDAGTGIRNLGQYLAKNGEGKGLNLYITHTHWDHIQGLPFFSPAYIEGNEMTVYGAAKINGVKKDTKTNLEENIKKYSTPTGVFKIEDEGIKQVLEKQQKYRNFPVPLDALKGIKDYFDFIPGSTIYDTETLKIDTLELNHPGGCISYKFTEIDKDGGKKIFVFSTDFEPDDGDYDKRLQRFWKGADLVIADAQYEPKDTSGMNPFMEGWGHSDFMTDLRMATKAGVKILLGTHHEPKMDDDYHNHLEEVAKDAARMLARQMKKKAVDFEFAKEGDSYHF